MTRMVCLNTNLPLYNFNHVHREIHILQQSHSFHYIYNLVKYKNIVGFLTIKYNIYTVKPVCAVTSIKQSPVLKGHIFLVLS